MNSRKAMVENLLQNFGEYLAEGGDELAVLFYECSQLIALRAKEVKPNAQEVDPVLQATQLIERTRQALLDEF